MSIQSRMSHEIFDISFRRGHAVRPRKNFSRSALRVTLKKKKKEKEEKKGLNPRQTPKDAESCSPLRGKRNE